MEKEQALLPAAALEPLLLEPVGPKQGKVLSTCPLPPCQRPSTKLREATQAKASPMPPALLQTRPLGHVGLQSRWLGGFTFTGVTRRPWWNEAKRMT